METPETKTDEVEKVKDAPAKLRVGRIEVGINIVVQLVVLIAMLVMVNYTAGKYFKRWSWIGKTSGDLSDMTRSLLGSLQKPMQAIVFFSQPGEAEADARAMLREYEFASGGKLTVEDVDPVLNFTRARDLQAKYKFGAIENVIILDYDGRSKFINSSEMAEMEQRDQMEEIQARMQGKNLPPPRMLAFKGEQVLTNEILALTEAKQNKLYLVNGHGEFDTVNKKLLVLQEYTKRQNLALTNLTLADVEKIPDDANMVMVLGPKFDWSERDLKILSDYWDRKGRIFMAIGKTAGKTPNLFAWLAVHGVKPQDDYVLRVANVGGMAALQSAAIVSANPTPVTSGLEGVAIELLGATQSFILDRAKETTEQLKLTGLLVSPKDFWGDVDYNVGDTDAPIFDPRKDRAGPLTMGVIIEKGASADPNVKLETSRLVVVGNSDFVSDEGFRVGPAAIDVASNSINWLLNREVLIKIPPKQKEKLALSLSLDKLNAIRVWVVLYIPLTVALIGIYYLCARYGRNLFILTAWLAFGFLVLVGAYYVLLWKLGMEEAKTVPRNLIIAIGVATSLTAVSIIVNHYENQKRVAAKN
jgi:hypothetical protein